TAITLPSTPRFSSASESLPSTAGHVAHWVAVNTTAAGLGSACCKRSQAALANGSTLAGAPSAAAATRHAVRETTLVRSRMASPEHALDMRLLARPPDRKKPIPAANQEWMVALML